PLAVNDDNCAAVGTAGFNDTAPIAHGWPMFCHIIVTAGLAPARVLPAPTSKAKPKNGFPSHCSVCVPPAGARKPLGNVATVSSTMIPGALITVTGGVLGAPGFFAVPLYGVDFSKVIKEADPQTE